MKLTDKQKEVIRKMRDGGIFIIGQSERTGRLFFQVASDSGITPLTSRVFANLLDKGIIYQQLVSPHRYILTELGKTINL